MFGEIIPTNVVPTGFTKRTGSEVMDAHNEWRNRPADEAVYTVDELVARTGTLRAQSVELEGIKWADLQVSPDENGALMLGLRNGSAAAFNNYSVEQVCNLPAKSGGSLAPADFLTKLSPQLAADVLTERLNIGVARKADAKLLVTPTTVRSVMTDVYTRVWDHELAERIAGLCERGTWQPAEAFKQAGGGTVTHAWGEQTKLPLGWVGDRSMFVCLVDYEGAVTVNGQTYARFFMLSNSEVGAGRLKIVFGLMDFACCNFILWGCTEVYEASFTHVGSVRERWDEISAGMRHRMTTDTRDQIATGIEAASAYLLGENKDQVIDATRNATGLSKAIVADAYARAEVTPRYGNPNTAWAMLNGITEASQHAVNTMDKRSVIDAKAARLMDLVKN